MTVYVDPQEPGCPQVGDVVVVQLGDKRKEWTGVLVYWETGSRCWVVRDHEYEHGPILRIRRPMEAELAQWALNPEEAGGLRPITGAP